MSEKEFDQYMLLIETLYKRDFKLYGAKYAIMRYYSRLNELVGLFALKKANSNPLTN